MKIKYIIFFALILFFSGCIQGNARYGFNQSKVIFGEVPSSSPDVCGCFVCTANQTYDGSDLSDARLTRYPLLGSNCSYKPECNETYANQTWNAFLNMSSSTGRTYLLPFGYGFGPTFGDFEIASAFSRHSLYFASQWFYDDDMFNDTGPRYPDVGRLKIYLKKGVVPVIVVLKNYSKADSLYYVNLSQKLNEVNGPIFVAPYAKFDVEDLGDLIMFQLHAQTIKTYCPKCLVIMAPDINLNTKNNSFRNVTDLTELYNLLSTNPTFENEFDMFGLFSFINKQDTKGLASVGLTKALLKSRELLNRTSKPSIILAQTVYPGLQESLLDDEQVELTNNTINLFYKRVFQHAPAISSSGVLAVIFYNFYPKSSQEHLNVSCAQDISGIPSECDYSLYPAYADFNDLDYLDPDKTLKANIFGFNAEKHFKEAFYQAKKMESDNYITYISIPDYFIFQIPDIFSSNGDFCVSCVNYSVGRYDAYSKTINYSLSKNDMILRLKEENHPYEDLLYDIYVLENPVCFYAPWDTHYFNSLPMPSFSPSFTSNLTLWGPIGRMVEIWSERTQTDPNAIRALISIYSDLSKCVVYYNKDHSSFGFSSNHDLRDYINTTEAQIFCNSEIYDQNNNEVYSTNTIEAYNSSTFCLPESEFSDPSQIDDNCVPAQMGITGLPDVPGIFYKQGLISISDMPDHIKKCGGINYVPYDKNQSICAASYLFRQLMDLAQIRVNNLEHTWGHPDYADYQNNNTRKKMLSFIIASEAYLTRHTNEEPVDVVNRVGNQMRLKINEFHRAKVGAYHPTDPCNIPSKLYASYSYCCNDPSLDFVSYLYDCITPDVSNIDINYIFSTNYVFPSASKLLLTKYYSFSNQIDGTKTTCTTILNMD